MYNIEHLLIALAFGVMSATIAFLLRDRWAVKPSPEERPPDPPPQALQPPERAEPQNSIAVDVVIDKLDEMITLMRKYLAAIYGTNIQGLDVIDEREASIREKAEIMQRRYPNLTREEALDRVRAMETYRR